MAVAPPSSRCLVLGPWGAGLGRAASRKQVHTRGRYGIEDKQFLISVDTLLLFRVCLLAAGVQPALLVAIAWIEGFIPGCQLCGKP